MIDDTILISVLDMLATRAENTGDTAEAASYIVAQHALELAGQAVDLASKLSRGPTPTGATRNLDEPFTVSDTGDAACWYPLTLGLGAVGLLSQAYVTATVGAVVHDAYGMEQTISVLVSPPSYVLALFLWVPAGDAVTLATTTANSGTVTLGTPVELVFS